MRYRLVTLMVVVLCVAVVLAAVERHRAVEKEMRTIESRLLAVIAGIPGAKEKPTRSPREGIKDQMPRFRIATSDGYPRQVGGVLRGEHRVQGAVRMQHAVMVHYTIRAPWFFFPGQPTITLNHNNAVGGQETVDQIISRYRLLAANHPPIQ